METVPVHHPLPALSPAATAPLCPSALTPLGTAHEWVTRCLSFVIGLCRLVPRPPASPAAARVRISFLFMNNIPLYGRTTFCLSIHPRWAFHPPVAGFRLSAAVNNAAMTLVRKYLLEPLVSVFWGIRSDVGPMTILHLI